METDREELEQMLQSGVVELVDRESGDTADLSREHTAENISLQLVKVLQGGGSR